MTVVYALVAAFVLASNVAAAFALGTRVGKRSKAVLRPVLTGRHLWIDTPEGVDVAMDGGVIVALVMAQHDAPSAPPSGWRVYLRTPTIGSNDAGTLQWSSDLESRAAARERANAMLKQTFAHLVKNASGS